MKGLLKGGSSSFSSLVKEKEFEKEEEKKNEKGEKRKNKIFIRKIGEREKRLTNCTFAVLLISLFILILKKRSFWTEYFL